MPLSLGKATAVACLLSLASTAFATNTPLPTIDLGYLHQRATTFNTTGQYYNFSNIRYAAPPTGQFRFREPQTPAQENRSSVFTGETGKICPQANPAWESTASQFLVDYFGEGKTGNYTPSDFSNATSTGGQDGRTTEDCLFLDVLVPQNIFDEKKAAPVLVWIYGGGYTYGSKEGSGNPAGLIARSQENNSTGVVYVAINYRLGAFGWLAGPTLQDDGVANAGLYDQRFALEWIQKHISKFGGDPSRVTVIGESAGGGSIEHQITAYGGLKGSTPFQQAILQSPGFEPIVSTVVQENMTQNYLKLLNVSTIEQARALPFERLQRANIQQVGASSYGTFTYGPAVDGVFVPQLPGQLLARGQFDKSLKVMVGHNTHEGIFFTSPYISTSSDLLTQLQSFLPTAIAFPQVFTYLTSTLYPPIFNGSQAESYTNQIARAVSITSDSSFVCNTRYLTKALPSNQTYAYLFSQYPGYHGQDIPYTFWNGDSSINGTVAMELQRYITNFALSGSPGGGFPSYGRERVKVLGAGVERDDAANSRCDWWQKALYY